MPPMLAIIKPVTTRNLCANPSFENSLYTGWSGVTGGTSFVTNEDARFGILSLKIISSAEFATTYYSRTLTVGTEYTFSLYVKTAENATYSVYFWDQTSSTQIGDKYTWTGAGEWERAWVTETIEGSGWVAGTSRTIRCYVEKLTGDSGGFFYIDGAQIEEATAGGYPTTYCDGEQSYCKWDGERHISTSTRAFASLYAAGARDVGEIVPLKNANTLVAVADGFGMPPTTDIAVPQPLSMGSFWQGTYVQPREMNVLLTLVGTTSANYRALRQAVIDLIKPGLVRGNDRFTLLWASDEELRTADILAIRAVQRGGFSMVAPRTYEVVPLQMLAHYPLWRRFEPRYYNLSARQPIDDVNFLLWYDGADWRNVNEGVRPAYNVAGNVKAIVETDSGVYLVGGRFNKIGPENSEVDAIGLAEWDSTAGTWDDVGLTSANASTSMQVNAIAYDSASGDIYIGGSEIVIGGVDFGCIARYDAGSTTWVAMQQGVRAETSSDLEEVTDLQIIGTDLYVGGQFEYIAPASPTDPYTGGTSSPGIAKWDMSGLAWAAVTEAAGSEVLDADSRSFETNTDGFSEVGTTAFTRVTVATEGVGSLDPAPNGTYAAKLTSTGGIEYTANLEPGRRYQWKFYTFTTNTGGTDRFSYEVIPTYPLESALTNRGFESGTTGYGFDAGWGTTTPTDPPEGTTVATNNTIVPGAGGESIWQDVTLAPNTTYKFSAAVKAEWIGTGVSFFWYVYDGALGYTNAIASASTTLDTPSSIWITKTVTFATNSGTSWRLLVKIRPSSSVGTFIGGHTDDWRLWKVSNEFPLTAAASNTFTLANSTWTEQTVTFDTATPAGDATTIPYELILKRPTAFSSAYYTDHWRLNYLGGALTDDDVVRVTSLDVDDDDNLIIGGEFQLENAANYNRVVKWTGTRFVAYGGGISGYDDHTISLVYYDANRARLIVSGEFVDGDDTTYWLQWDGTRWVAMPDMVEGYGLAIAYDSINDEYHVGGQFTADTNDTYLGNGYALWDGDVAWEPGAVDVPGTTIVGEPQTNAILIDGTQVYLGLSSYGIAYAKATSTVTYNGTADGYPVIKVRRDGGSGGTLTEIANLTTGARLGFTYSLADGETLTVDLRPDASLITSNLYGNRLTALDEDSATDLGQFVLVPGENKISVYVADDNGNVTVTIEVYDEHWSVDGA